MDGLTFLENLMRLRPMPVVMVSSLTQRGADVTLRALELGAIDFVAKPRIDIAGTLADYEEELIAKVKVAAGARVSARVRSAAPREQVDRAAQHVRRAAGVERHARCCARPIASSRSARRPAAPRRFAKCSSEMPPDAPAIVISQHIPAAFSKPFAERMNRCSAMAVCEAQDGQQILPGHAYIAPGDQHLLVERDGARYLCRLSNGPHVNRHRPSVDVMFRSVAQNVGRTPSA